MKRTRIYYLVSCLLLAHNQHILTEPQTLKDIYDFWADDYKALMEKTNYQIANWFSRNQHLLPDKDCLVLDLGCADGSTGEVLSHYRPAYTFFGIDFSEKMVKNCIQKDMYIDALQADLNNGLPETILQQKHDIIIATGCLEFIQNHDNLFRQIEQCLNPHGLFWLTLAIKKNDSEDTFLDTKITSYTEEEARAILTIHGFMIIDFEINPCAYVESSTKQNIPYFMIIAKTVQTDR